MCASWRRGGSNLGRLARENPQALRLGERSMGEAGYGVVDRSDMSRRRVSGSGKSDQIFRRLARLVSTHLTFSRTIGKEAVAAAPPPAAPPVTASFLVGVSRLTPQTLSASSRPPDAD